jgi:CheY-like chemotaxis protein
MEEYSQKQILVAEDDPATAMMLQFNLQRAGYAVTTCADGAEAWREARTQRYDLLITDFRMPIMDGGALCRNLRTTSEYAETPMILISGKGPGLDLPSLRQELRLAGAFSKPIRPSALTRCVDEQLRGVAEPIGV